jgi:hypothetical protein
MKIRAAFIELWPKENEPENKNQYNKAHQAVDFFFI